MSQHIKKWEGHGYGREVSDPAQQLLPRLEGVIVTGRGWRSYCPNCGGTSRKLSMAQGDNGTLLITCFCCHDTPAVLAALNLQMGDLFQRRDLPSMTPAERSQLRQAAMLSRWRAANEVLVAEANVVLIAANQLGDGVPLDVSAMARLRLAALRIFDTREVLSNGR